jgi:hypothetical protein
MNANNKMITDNNHSRQHEHHHHHQQQQEHKKNYCQADNKKAAIIKDKGLLNKSNNSYEFHNFNEIILIGLRLLLLLR